MRTRAHNFSLPPKDDRNFFYRETFRPIETYFSLGALVLSFLALATLFILFILSCQRCLDLLSKIFPMFTINSPGFYILSVCFVSAPTLTMMHLCITKGT